MFSDRISKYMTANGYVLSTKSKNYHALDSFVYEYVVAPLELFASKTVALLTRTAPRDLYDMHNMVKFGLFDESEEAMLSKCAVFYSAIGAAQPPEKFELDNIRKVSSQQIKRDLDPVLRKGERFDLDFAQKEVRDYLASILMPTKEEELF